MPDQGGAWSEFWAQRPQPGKQQGGCLPAQWNAIGQQQAAAWQAFCALIPVGASVLDLATGDGRVLRWLGASRPDLTLTGTDLAPHLPPAPAGTTVLPGVAMEALPFADGQFTCIVSQFGLEYSDLPKSTRELARVLADGGLVGLLTHRIDGPILAHNLARAEQILWAIDTVALPDEARAALAARTPGANPVPENIAAAPAKGAALFGPASAAWEIAEAIRRCLDYGRNDAPANVIGLIDTIERRARNELARIESLKGACEQTQPPDRLRTAMAEVGFAEDQLLPLHSPLDPRPFADFRVYRRMT